ncbi:MAG TPA: hypothetical protein VG938_00645, partial [Verrucomicrobiae bacterium]|nr:hypothetical protein [Verrucomicrobiae bacterium]
MKIEPNVKKSSRHLRIFPLLALVTLTANAATTGPGEAEMSDAAAKKIWTFRTDDTVVKVAVSGNKQYIVGLENPTKSWNWTPNPSEVPLLSHVSFGSTNLPMTPDWVYRDAMVEKSAGEYKVTLRFTSSTPNLELKSYWQARKGCGPVENWMTVENKTGQNVIYKYADVISSCLTAVADGKVDLWRFRREFVGRNDGGVFVDSLSQNSKIVSLIQGDPIDILPYVVMDVGRTHGLYIGYGWDLGQFVNSTGSDPQSVVTKFNLGDSGEISEEDGKVLNIPYTFYGAYKGDVDDGCNNMKRWFWNYKVPGSLRDNVGEPLVELHVPFYDEAGWSSYLKAHPLKTWGVDLVKMDINWLIPGDHHLDWNPDPKKWPKGLTFGAMAHSNNLKDALYMDYTYQGANLATTQGREAQEQALLERYDKGWYDYWRTDGAPENQDTYLQHEGFIAVIDFMIAKRPGFRWENCCNGGRIKSFDTAQRMTFMTTEDYAKAITFRQAFYANSYVLNPVQLKADIALDWGDAHTVAWDKYNFRSGLLGAIMVCGS